MWLSPIACVVALVGMLLIIVGFIKSAIAYNRVYIYAKAIAYYIVKKEGKMPNNDIMLDCYRAVRYVDKKEEQKNGRK